jgi:hypothetical protein
MLGSIIFNCSISLVQGVHLVIALDAPNIVETTSKFGPHQHFSNAKLVQRFNDFHTPFKGLYVVSRHGRRLLNIGIIVVEDF